MTPTLFAPRGITIKVKFNLFVRYGGLEPPKALDRTETWARDPGSTIMPPLPAGTVFGLQGNDIALSAGGITLDPAQYRVDDGWEEGTQIPDLEEVTDAVMERLKSKPEALAWTRGLKKDWVQLVLEAYKLRLEVPDATANAVAEVLGKTLVLNGRKPPANSKLRKLAAEIFSFDDGPLMPMQSRERKRLLKKKGK